jgi:rhodanese-related sulfurtransferase
MSAVDDHLQDVRRALPPRMAASAIEDFLARGGLLVDTRPVGLRDQDGLVPGAVIVDRNQLEWRLDPTSDFRIPEVADPDQQVVLFCDEGYASSLAAASLQRLGVRGATDLDGGFQAWRALQPDRSRVSLSDGSP